MPTYRFSLLGTDGKVQSNRVMESTSEDAACEIGSELLLESSCQVLEVWCGSTLIFRVAKVDG